MPVLCSPPSGSVFPEGTTTVACTATDAAGNRAQAFFPVIVTVANNTLPGSGSVTVPAANNVSVTFNGVTSGGLTTVDADR